MPSTPVSFLQSLIDPIADPLCLVSSHDGTVLAQNEAMSKLSGSFGRRDIVGENYYDTAREFGLDPEQTPIHKARMYGGRQTNSVAEPIAVHVIATQEDGYILCSAWQLGREDIAAWTHDWYWMGLKNALQMEEVAKKSELATSLLADVNAVTALMKQTFAQRAEHLRNSPWFGTLELPRWEPAKPDLRPVE